MAGQQEEIYFLRLSLPSSIAPRNYYALFNNGCLAIPCTLLHYYAHLKPYPLSPGEVLFVLQTIEYALVEGALPSYNELSVRMGVTHKMVRRYAKSLEEKGYLHREPRAGFTNQFDLTRLFDALLKASSRTNDETEKGDVAK